MDELFDFDARAVVELAQALVRLPTGWCRARTRSRRLRLTWSPPSCAISAGRSSVEEVASGRPNVVGVITGRGAGRTLMFEGHTDVVTPGDESAWAFPPFSGDIVDGRLRGRGSADMKGGVAAMIHAARAVQLGGFDGRIIVAALADEEGMMLGAKHFAASELASSGIDGVIVCEPEAGEVCAVAKGAIRLRVDLQGVMAHGAMPTKGRNSLPAMGSLLMGLSELERQVAESVGSHAHLGDFYLTPTVLAAGDPESAQRDPGFVFGVPGRQDDSRRRSSRPAAPDHQTGRADRRRCRPDRRGHRYRRPTTGRHAARTRRWSRRCWPRTRRSPGDRPSWAEFRARPTARS